MIIKSSKYIISAAKPENYPEIARPEIAMAGRSNVGKSSLINKILNRKNLARTSQHPGKTQTINFYLINEEFYLVDLPGYGYAKVSQKMRELWGKWINQYLQESTNLRGIIQLVDIRHPPSVQDVQMYHFLIEFGLPYLVVATKLDKIKKSQIQKQLKVVRTEFNMTSQDIIVPFSAVTGDGKNEVLQFIEGLL